MKIYRRLLFGSLLASLAILRGGVHAQGPGAVPGKLYTQQKHFILPIELDERDRATISEVLLYVKSAPSEPWICRQSVLSTQKGFDFQAAEDGEYWFATATIDRTGKLSPADTSHLTPVMTVVVDTVPPDVTMQTLPPSPKGVLVAFKVNDANPDPHKLKVEFQMPDKSWQVLQPLPDDAMVFRVPGPAVPETTFRATVTDRAGNTTSKTMSLASAFSVAAAGPLPGSDRLPAPATSLGSHSEKPSVPMPMLPPPDLTHLIASRPLPETTPEASRPMVDMTPPSPSRNTVDLTRGLPSPPPEIAHSSVTPASSESGSATVPQAPPATAVAPSAPAGAEPAASGPFHQLLNATKVSLEYQIEQQGPTGVSKVEVWVTRDTGNTWTCLLEDKKGHSPVEFELPGEGLYGVSLVVYNGNGVSSAVPAKGDAPDYLVEIDLTRPAAQLLAINPGVDKEAGTLHITWAASDKNLGSTPVDLYYATKRGGPWQPIVRGSRNDGSYRWVLPKDQGSEFYVRMDVTDRAGNLTRCEAPQPVLVDLVKPKAKVLTITASNSRLAPANGE